MSSVSAQPAKWEYAEIVCSRELIFVPVNGGLRPVIQATIRWSVGEAETDGVDWAELADKLMAPKPKKEGSATIHRLRVFNRIGADGWELIEHSGGDGDSDSGSWTFRRRVP
jgi:hypothetical protein